MLPESTVVQYPYGKEQPEQRLRLLFNKVKSTWFNLKKKKKSTQVVVATCNQFVVNRDQYTFIYFSSP